jgi:hypothetical protein
MCLFKNCHIDGFNVEVAIWCLIKMPVVKMAVEKMAVKQGQKKCQYFKN